MMKGKAEHRKRSSLSLFRLAQCLLLLIPSWGIIRLHRRLILGISEEYSLWQGILELPTLTQDAFAPIPGTRYLATNNKTERGPQQNQTDAVPQKSYYTAKATTRAKAIISESLRQTYRENTPLNDEEESQREETKAKARRELILKREKRVRDDEEEIQRLEEAKAKARRRRILEREKRVQKLAEEEERRNQQREDYESTDVPSETDAPEFEGIPTYKTVGKPKKPVQLGKKMPNATADYAYAFVMGGVNEADGKYKGMLYNILIAAYILDKEGSVADVVVYVQMSANSTQTELPEDDTLLLNKVNVQVRYLPKPKIENFHQIIMQKMVVLDLVEYRRVLFLDTDVMPFCNLDYVFQLSDGPNPVLKENLIIALSGSPANAGFFMLSPKQGSLEALRKIVASQQERAKDLPSPHFDERIGWGHAIRQPDKWWTINKTHTRRAWKFVGAHADQGLLYHWVKYVERSVSIVSGVEVDNYAPKNSRERIRLEKTLIEPFNDYTCLPQKYEESFGELPTYQAQGMAPYRDFIHFLGSSKPWKRRVQSAVATNLDSETPEQYWFHMLRVLNHELEMGIDFDNWTRIRRTPLGSLPKKHLMKELMDANQALVQT